MSLIETTKTILLAGLIALGTLATHKPAVAGEQQILTVAGGCFWCVEADFEKVPGVIAAVSGFTGGSVDNPTYKQVVGGGTGHLEAVQITFDASRVTRDQLLTLFFRSIDPTDAGGQFCDRGTSYASAVFVSGPAEKSAAERAKAQAQSDLGQKIVTPILPAGPFYVADDYHQDFYKGTKLILTRYGPRKQSVAYRLYRDSCGRDARVRALWGDAAAFAGS